MKRPIRKKETPGDRLNIFAEKKFKTLSALSDASGIKTQQLGRSVTDASTLTMDTLGKLAALGLSIDWLLTGKGNMMMPTDAKINTGVAVTIDETESDSPLLLETNIDNMDSEIFPYVIERLLEAGAHDAYLTPIIMKKGRPAIMLSALVPSALLDTALDIIYTETPTLGVRIQTIMRKKLPRKIKTVSTSFGKVTVKEIRTGNGLRRVPEFEECKRIAREQSLSLRDIQEQLFNELNPEHSN